MDLVWTSSSGMKRMRMQSGSWYLGTPGTTVTILVPLSCLAPDGSSSADGLSSSAVGSASADGSASAVSAGSRSVTDGNRGAASAASDFAAADFAAADFETP